MTGNDQETKINVLGDSSQSLQTLNLLDLQQFTREKSYAANASKDFHLFYVGRDDVHDILKYVLSRVSISLYLNMFGFDDDELNDILMAVTLHAISGSFLTIITTEVLGRNRG